MKYWAGKKETVLMSTYEQSYKYKPITLSSREREIVDTLKKHVRDMFPTAVQAGHDHQHIESQMMLWETVGGSVLEEKQFDGVNKMIPFLVAPGHDLNRLPIFEPKHPRSFKKPTKDLEGEARDHALAYNAEIDAFNERAELRALGMYDGFLKRLGIVPDGLRERALAVLEYPDGNSKSRCSQEEFDICADLDKIPGQIYAWRCACVGTGQRVTHVVKHYLIATPEAEARHIVEDEGLESWADDLWWAAGPGGWDDSMGLTQFPVRSQVLKEIYAPWFEQVRRVRNETLEQLRFIGFKV